MSESYESVRKHLGRAAAKNKEFYDYGVMNAEYKPQEMFGITIRVVVKTSHRNGIDAIRGLLR